MFRRPLGALTAALALVLCATPAAEAALSGSDNGYTLRFAHGTTTLTLPSPSRASFQIKCGKPGKEESLIALAALGGASRQLAGPGGRPGHGVKRCIVTKNTKRKVATIHLH